jgi:hypothetical protein
MIQTCMVIKFRYAASLSTERNISGSRTPHHGRAIKWQQQTTERTAKFGVEDGVDDRIEEAVEITEPDAQREQDRLDAADRITGVGIIANTDGVDDIERKERKPTEKKDT